MCDQQRLRPACAYGQSDQSLYKSLEYSMTDKLLTEHHLELLSTKGGYRGYEGQSKITEPYLIAFELSKMDIYLDDISLKLYVIYLIT